MNHMKLSSSFRSLSRSISLSLMLIGILGSSSLAQSSSNSQSSQTYFGVSASAHYIIPSLDFHLGVKDALGENIDLRGTVSSFLIDGSGFIAGGINGIMNLNTGNNNVNTYVGFGPRALILVGETGGTAQNNLALAVGGLWGTEFNALGSTRPFVELNGSLPLTVGNEVLPGFLPIVSLSAGVNFHF